MPDKPNKEEVFEVTNDDAICPKCHKKGHITDTGDDKYVFCSNCNWSGQDIECEWDLPKRKDER